MYSLKQGSKTQFETTGLKLRQKVFELSKVISVRFFSKEINTFLPQGCIKCIKSDSKGIKLYY